MTLNELTIRLQILILQTQLNAATLAYVVALPWGFYALNRLFSQKLLYLGIIPRRWLGLRGILFAPLLHANFNHLFFNTIPLVILSDFVLYSGLTYYLSVTIWIILLSGLFIWIFCKPGLYIGASSLITGYWALLVSAVYEQGTFTAIVLGLVSFYYFAGILSGLFPKKNGGSWQGHMCGLVAGIIVSILPHYEVFRLFYD